MSVFRSFRCPLVSIAAPLLGGLLCACGAAGGSDDDESGGLSAYSGAQPNLPAPNPLGAAGAAGSGSNTPPAPSGSGSAVNEGAQNGQLPVAGNNSSNSGSGSNGGSSPNAGAGGTASTGNPTAPSGAAGAGMSPPQTPPDPPPQTTPSTPVPPTLPTPPGEAFFFDDFEGGAAGTQPAAWERWINYTTVAGNALGNPQFALLDTAEAFRGNQSVHFHTEGATQPAMLTMRLPTGMNRIHIRAFVMSRIAVGGVAADSVSNHESLIGLRATSNDGNDEIRFGGAKGALGFNMVGPGRNDAVAPLQNLWGSAPGMAAGSWHCVEIAFINDGTARATATLDGTVVRDVTSPAGWHIPVSQTWLNGLYNEVFLGWQSFSPQPANDVWMDDVVLSAQPIGCN